MGIKAVVTKYNNKKSRINVFIMKFAKKIQISLTKQIKGGILIEEINLVEINLKGANTMILEFTCTNHKSIKDKVGFSFIASSDSTYDENLREYGKIKVLRSAIIYGPNGSGKSNFLNALEFVRNLVSGSINHQPGQGIFQAPHKLSSKSEPTEYTIQFVKDEVRYAYGFSIANNEVAEEYLYFFPNGKQVKIFEREKMEIKAGDKYKKVFELSLNVLKENRLFLSKKITKSL